MRRCGGASVARNENRVSINLRVDTEKLAMLENLRNTGFGIAQTVRNRSDVYNEVLGYGMQTLRLRQELGEADFEKIWVLVNKVNWKRINLDYVTKIISAQEEKDKK
jgi:hypothetical protein